MQIMDCRQVVFSAEKSQERIHKALQVRRSSARRRWTFPPRIVANWPVNWRATMWRKRCSTNAKANGAIIAPRYDIPADAIARERLQSCFPDREIVMVPIGKNLAEWNENEAKLR